MDTAPYSINQSASVQRCYRQFRNMGLRHLVAVDSDHQVVGIITRKDITQARLDQLWLDEVSEAILGYFVLFDCAYTSFFL